MNIEDQILEKGIKPKDFAVGNQKLKCPECQPPHNLRDRPLSLTIETDSAVWYCHHCEYKGNAFIKEGGRYGNRSFIKPKKKYVVPEQKINPRKPGEMYDYFSIRGISKETVDMFNLYKEGNWFCFEYKDADDTLVNIKYRTANKDFKQSAEAKRTLYNYQNIINEEEIIFVEGEIDVLSLAEAGFINSTTLPDGAPAEASYRPDDARFKALENCPVTAKKIILFTDSDKAGKALHNELLHRFGKDICWYVDMPDNCKDANDVLVNHGREKLKEIVDEATPYPVSGLYTVNSYYSQVLDLYDGKYIKPFSTGLGNLDSIYKVMLGTFHCITGIPNHGKSSFLDQVLISMAIKHGWRFAIFSPEQSTSMHIRRLTQMKAEKPFEDGLVVEKMSREELEETLDWLSNHFYFIETRESVPDVDLILKVAKSSLFKYGIKGIIIDPYNEVNARRKGNAREDEHIRDFISKCKRFARIHDVVVWVVAHPTKLPKNNDGSYAPPTAYDISGAAHWHNQADVVITVHRDFDDDSIRVITRKIREQGFYGNIGETMFSYDIDRRCFSEKKTEVDWSI